MLLRDYASFVVHPLSEESVRTLRAYEGLDDTSAPTSGTPGALIPNHRQAVNAGYAMALPETKDPVIRYLFLFEPERRTLVFSGEAPDAWERSLLQHHLELATASPLCGPNTVRTFDRLGSLLDLGPVEPVDWPGLLETDAEGRIKRLYGIAFDERAAAEYVMPFLLGDVPSCSYETLLPDSLTSTSDVRQVASIVLRDGREDVMFRTEPHDSGGSITAELPSDIPFVGWTLEVAMNPEVIRPMFPYGLRGSSWPILALLSGIVVGSSLLAIRSQRRDSELSRLRQNLISNVSHELRTPLARIRLFNELLLEDRQPDEVKRRHYRRKLGDDVEKPRIIETVYGFGYRLAH